MNRSILDRDPGPGEVVAWANFMAAQMAAVEDEFTRAPEFAGCSPRASASTCS